MDSLMIVNVVRAALEKGGQHILIAPDGGVSIWPDTEYAVTCCKDCKNWVLTCKGDGHGGFEKYRACHITEMKTESDDYCSYAEAIDNET